MGLVSMTLAYLGVLVELADRNEIYRNPLHPYTEALMSAVAIPDPDLRETRKRIILQGEIPSPRNPPSGCPFHPRCSERNPRCSVEAPPLRQADEPGHLVACHYPEADSAAATVSASD